MSSMPTGNGMQRGPEDTSPTGTKLPGTRPSRAAANNARNAADLNWPADPMEQAGFGSENFVHACDYMGSESVRPTDVCCAPPDLAAMGNGGESFGGM